MPYNVRKIIVPIGYVSSMCLLGFCRNVKFRYELWSVLKSRHLAVRNITIFTRIDPYAVTKISQLSRMVNNNKVWPVLKIPRDNNPGNLVGFWVILVITCMTAMAWRSRRLCDRIIRGLLVSNLKVVVAGKSRKAFHL